MRLLGLDTGARRTGCASFDASVGIALPLDTITHRSAEELIVALQALITEKKFDRVILGLPRLPSGDEADQAAFARDIGTRLERIGVRISYIDERFTTPRQIQDTRRRLAVAPTSSYDGDAAAAIAILESISKEQLEAWKGAN